MVARVVDEQGRIFRTREEETKVEREERESEATTTYGVCVFGVTKVKVQVVVPWDRGRSGESGLGGEGGGVDGVVGEGRRAARRRARRNRRRDIALRVVVLGRPCLFH